MDSSLHQSESAGSPIDASTPTVLLVEDEDPLREVIEGLLRARGYNVVAADSAEAALHAAVDFGRPIDVLLTDVSLPRMDGYTLASTLVGKGIARRVIYMSGYGEDPLLIRPIGGKLPTFVEKPFRLKELAETVNRVLQ